MGKWTWLLLGAGVLFIMYEREKASVKIAANQQATGVVNAAGRGTVKIIDETAGALGRWIGGLFSGSSSANTTSGSNSGTSSNSAAWDVDSFEDLYDYGDI